MDSFTFFIHNLFVFIFVKFFVFVILSSAFLMKTLFSTDFHPSHIIFYRNTNYFAYFYSFSLYILLKNLMVKITHSANFIFTHCHIKLIFGFENCKAKSQENKFPKNYENNSHFLFLNFSFQNLRCLINFKFK